MAAAERANYEVQVMRDGRWVMQSVLDGEEPARAAAARLMADKKCEGARVIRNWHRADGRMVESEIFCQTRTIRDDGPMRIVPVETAPPRCEQTEDYYAQTSRALMGRIFHDYFEKTYITPTEMIHNFRELKRIQDKDSLVPSAVDRVATLQSRQTEQDAKSRRDEIFKTIEQMSSRARKAEQTPLPKLNGRFSACFDAIRAPAGSEERDFLALVVLSRELVNTRNWLGKLDRLCALAADEPDPDAIRLLDGVIADVLGADVVQEILGWQPSLGHAIRSMLDLADGRLDGKDDLCESSELLNRLLGEGKLPASRLCLVDRAHRQLRSANPLRRSEPSKEMDEYKAVLARMVGGNRLYDGPNTADALTTRYTRMVEQGGAAGKRAAIAATFRSMPDRATGVIYLCELARSDYAAEFATDIAAQFDIVLSTRRLADLCLPTLPAKDRMQRATLAHKAMAASPYPAELRAQVTAHIDTILERYIVDEQIVEKLDHPSDRLRDRAIRLVQFCAAGVLPEGKAMKRARQRILDLLRQPNFDAHFVEGIADPAAGQKTLRDFHALLVKAGFGPN